MPITYAPAEPFSALISGGYGRALQNNQDAPLLQRQREAQMQMASADADRRSRDASASADRAFSLEASRFRQESENAQFAGRLDAMDADRGAAANLQRDRFQLQAELNETELSQQEKMRLQRMKNSIGEITSDPTLTDEERRELLSLVKYKVSPLEQRMNKQKLKQEELLTDQKLKDAQLNGALRQMQMKAISGSAEDAMVVWYDPKFIAEESRRIRDEIADAGGIMGAPGGILGGATGIALQPEQIKKMAEQNAILAGAYTRGLRKPDGSFDQEKPVAGSGSAGAGRDQTFKPFNRADHIAEARRAIRDEDKNRKDAELPRREDSEVDRIKAELDFMESEYEASIAKSQAAGGVPTVGKGGRRPQKTPDRHTVFAGVQEGTRGGGIDPERGEDSPGLFGTLFQKGKELREAKTQEGFTLSHFDKSLNKVLFSAGLTEGDKAAARYLVNRGQKIVSQFPDPAERPAPVVEELKLLGENYKKILAKVKEPSNTPVEDRPLGGSPRTGGVAPAVAPQGRPIDEDPEVGRNQDRPLK